jgi:hypothetical protein
MKTTLAIFLVFLAGCASGPPREKYIGQPGDAMLFAQSPMDLRGTVERWSGTSFTLIYPNEENACRAMNLGNIKRMVDENKLRADIENSRGLVVPAQRFVSVKADFSHVINAGGGIQHSLKCTSAPHSILTESNGKYLFEFSMSDGLCQINVFDVKESGEKRKIPSIPILFCAEDKNEKQNRSTSNISQFQ